MSDTMTDPAQIAQLIKDDQEYRTYVVLSLQDLKARVYSLESKQLTVNSSVNDYEKNKVRVEMIWKVLAGIAGFAGIIWMIVEAVAKAIAWAKSGAQP